MITKKKIVMKMGGSLVVVLGRELTKELKIEEGDPIKFSIMKVSPRKYFCFIDEYEFISDDEIANVICPICGRNDTIKLLIPTYTGERRLIKGEMSKDESEDLDEVEEEDEVEDDEVEDEDVEDEEDVEEVDEEEDVEVVDEVDDEEDDEPEKEE